MEDLLKKGAVEQVCPQKDQFLSNIFIVKKKDRGSRPAISLKELSQYIFFLHFKMESLHSLETLLQKNENMPQLDLKNAYLYVPLSHDNRKRVTFQWEGTLCQFLWPCTNLICFQKTPKDPHGPFKKDRDTHSNLFGRHDHWQDKGKDYGSTKYSHSFTSVPGICYKSEQVSDNTSSGDRISGNDS